MDKIQTKKESFEKYLNNPKIVETIAVVHTIELDFDIKKNENFEIHKFWNPDTGELLAFKKISQ